jgi:hypothetical protein
MHLLSCVQFYVCICRVDSEFSQYAKLRSLKDGSTALAVAVHNRKVYVANGTHLG